jgi:cobalt-zinc-cadmium efflux system membrane fusion protein
LTAPAFAPLGGRVVETLVRVGDRVKRGARLVEVRSSELPLLHQEIESTSAAVRAKESEIARLERMLDARVGSGHDVMIARADLERLQIAERGARTRLASLAVAQAQDSASYFVLAPRAGTVVQIDALAGQVVGPERTSPLVTVASIEQVFVIGDVPARQAADLEPGAMARVRLGQGDQTELEGRIEFVAEVVDPERQTIPVRVRMENEKRLLRPNAFVELTFDPAGDKGVLRVPTQAVVSDGPQSVVFVEIGPGRYQRRSVKLGRQSGEWSEVRAGIERGERVVVSHALLLLNAVEAES